MTRMLISLMVFLWTVSAGWAGPVPYSLDIKASKVAFFYSLGGRKIEGSFQVSQAMTMVDLQDVRRSTLDVTIATKSVRAGDALVTIAMRGDDLLATKQYPSAHFVSSRVVPNANGARVTGDLTLKGVTRPVTLDAVFQRRADAPTDNSELILQVTGAVSRKAFDISGYPDLVGDIITLNFQVHLNRE
ncbi:YceI family protein [uncultured Shimia sp.]|uniref:YceI family protein n=1 Tax=uncultured Shimia sp. TaxID=573152 RepID=UPI002637E138|nr:YceI family protein [uncultured Shimia sp.]